MLFNRLPGNLTNSSIKKYSHPLQLFCWLIFLTILVQPFSRVYATPAKAMTDCSVALEIIAAPYAVVDSNKPGVQGPQVAVLGVRITNNDKFVQEPMQLHLGDGVTPGNFTANNGKALSLLSGETASRQLPLLDPGVSTVVYWSVSYPATFDITYTYSVWATGNDACRSEKSGKFTTQKSIGASSNKLLPKDSLLLLTPKSFAPGALVTLKIFRFDLGSIGQGPKPLEPYDAWLQPIGNRDFDPSCLRLVRSEVLLESISEKPFVDQLYFTNLKEYDKEDDDYVAYTFIALRTCTTTMAPYQQAASGSQEKYNDDYNNSTTRLKFSSSATPNLQLATATDKSTVTAGEPLQVTINSASSQSMGQPENGYPVVITAILPPGVTYVAEHAKAELPATLEYSTDQGLTWLSTLPSDPSLVTQIRWRLQKALDSTGMRFEYSVTINPTYTGNDLNFIATGGILNAAVLANAQAAVSGSLPTATPIPTPTPTATPTPDSGTQSGGEGGLESGPLTVVPSTFLGGIGHDTVTAGTLEVDAGSEQADPFHKARLLAPMTFKLDDLLPTQGPEGTTAKSVIPADVLAITSAPDAKAVDFIDGQGKVKAVVLGILSMDAPYPHDYGVCNRFKEYTIETVEPLPIALPHTTGDAWFWHSRAVKGAEIREDAFLLHIFVDENTRQFHIDSRWIKDHYPATFDFAFDYVFSLQIWSNDQAKSAALLTAILSRLSELDSGNWQITYHNQSQPSQPQVVVEQAVYQADAIQLTLQNATTLPQLTRIYGAWRSHIDRNTLQPFDHTLTLPAAETDLALVFPGLLDATIYVESNGFTDKIYQGGGLWFPIHAPDITAPTLKLGQCRDLSAIDSSDLLLAGCTELTTAPLQSQDQAGIGRTLNPNGRSVDVSPYKALRFWAKGDGTPIRILLESAGIRDSDYYQTVLTPDHEWRQYILPLTQFTQGGFGTATPFTATDLKAVVWLNAEATGKTMTLALDQVSFTNSGLLTLTELPTDGAATTARTLIVTAEGESAVSQVNAYYSIDSGVTFQAISLPQQSRTGVGTHFQGELPGQPLGTDVIYYLETHYPNGYRSRNPVDAPTSYYRYRVDDRAGLLLDDFAGEALRNRLNGANGIFNHPTDGGRLQAYRSAQQLRLDYDVREANQYAGYFTQVPALDVTPYTTLDLLLRGEQGGEQVRISLRNDQGIEKYVSVGDLLPGGITTKWQWVQLPLNTLAPFMDLRTLKSVSLVFAHGEGINQSRLYVQEMRFTTLATPLVIDSFEDGQLDANAQGMAYWTAAPNGVLNTTLVTDDAIQAGGKALQIDYTVNSGGYAIWSSGLNRPTVRADAVLTFWVKGAEQAIQPNLYLTTGTTRARVALAKYVTLHSQWQQVQIPLAVFAAQGLALNDLTSFQVVFEFGQGSGRLWIDNIRIGTPGAPQVDRRHLALQDMDEAVVALHLSDDGRWQGRSDVPWLVIPTSGNGSTTLSIHSIPWGLAPGVYTGKLTITTANGEQEIIATQLTVTATSAPAMQLYLPLVAQSW